MTSQIKIEYLFVPVGTVAPTKLQENEIWTDVGNRFDHQVFDHHQSNSGFGSSSMLIFQNHKKISKIFKNYKAIKITTHQNPDLDALCSTWLLTLVIRKEFAKYNFEILQSIVKLVDLNDQGIIENSNEITQNWVIIVRTLLTVELGKLNDEQKIKNTFKLFEKTYEKLTNEENFEKISEELITGKIKTMLNQAHTDYENDIVKAEIFTAKFNKKTKEICSNSDDKNTIEVDAVWFNEPTSMLLRELSRNDFENSPNKKGFNFLITSKFIIEINNQKYYRYIISVNPSTKLSLRGLGKILEDNEQAKEEKLNLDLFKGRERVPMGEGRFGLNVPSPWYDGRGHNYTIVDSPSFVYEDKSYVASCLNSEDIANVILKL